MAGERHGSVVVEPPFEAFDGLRRPGMGEEPIGHDGGAGVGAPPASAASGELVTVVWVAALEGLLRPAQGLGIEDVGLVGRLEVVGGAVVLVRQLEDRNRILEAQVIDLQNGLDAFEEKARNDLGMIKEGETFIQLIPGKVAEANKQ